MTGFTFPCFWWKGCRVFERFLYCPEIWNLHIFRVFCCCCCYFFFIKVTRKGLIFSLIIKILMKYQNFSFHQKIISWSCAVKILFLSFMCEDIGVAMVTSIILQAWLANYKRASHSGAWSVLLKFHSQNGFEVQRRDSYRWLSRWAAKFSHQYFSRTWRTFRKICRSLRKRWKSQ